MAYDSREQAMDLYSGPRGPQWTPAPAPFLPGGPVAAPPPAGQQAEALGVGGEGWNKPYDEAWARRVTKKLGIGMAELDDPGTRKWANQQMRRLRAPAPAAPVPTATTPAPATPVAPTVPTKTIGPVKAPGYISGPTRPGPFMPYPRTPEGTDTTTTRPRPVPTDYLVNRV